MQELKEKFWDVIEEDIAEEKLIIEDIRIKHGGYKYVYVDLKGSGVVNAGTIRRAIPEVYSVACITVRENGIKIQFRLQEVSQNE